MRLRLWVAARECPLVAAAQGPTSCPEAPDGCSVCPLRDPPEGVDVEWVQAGPGGLVGAVTTPDARAATALLRRVRAHGEQVVLVQSLPSPRDA